MISSRSRVEFQLSQQSFTYSALSSLKSESETHLTFHAQSNYTLELAKKSETSSTVRFLGSPAQRTLFAREMVISTGDIMDACRLIAREDELKLCVYESMKGAGIAGAGAFVGGLILGPVGLAIGGAVGGLVAASTSNSYTPLIHHLDSMTEEDRERLRVHLLRVVSQLEVTDAVMLMALVSSPSSAARQAITRGMGSFFGQSW